MAKTKAEQPRLVALDKPTLDALIEQFNEEYAVILHGSKVLIMRQWVGEDNVSQLRFLTVKDFFTLTAYIKIWNAKTERFLPVAPIWLQSDRRRQYDDIYFRPLDKEYKTRYNLWHGYGVLPKQGGKFDTYLDHIFRNICQSNESYYNWIIDWLADLIQKPYRKPGTAIVLRGEMGTGKGAFAKHLGKLFAKHYLPILHGGQLTGRFNHHLSDKVFVFVDESGWSHDKYGAGILRGMITESHIAIEMKGKDTITLENYSRFVIAANDQWVVPASMQDERRFACFDMGNENKQDKAFFAKIDNEMNNGGYEALLHFLMNHQYDEAVTRTIPQTEALKDQKLHSMPLEVQWWLNCIEDGRIGDFDLEDNEPSEIETDRFYKAYYEFCHILRQNPVNNNALPKMLKNYVDLKKQRKRTLIKREHFYFLPSVVELRQKFSEFLGQKYEFSPLE